MIAVLSGVLVGMMVAVPRGAWGDDAQEGAIRESVVKISASMRYPDLVRPWAKQSPSEASGTTAFVWATAYRTTCSVTDFAVSVDVVVTARPVLLDGSVIEGTRFARVPAADRQPAGVRGEKQRPGER